jgi:hypothetical protein
MEGMKTIPRDKNKFAKTSTKGDCTIDVYALFDDRSAAKIMLSAFVQGEGHKPTVESPVMDLTLRRSAERGFYSALGHYQKQGLPPYPGHRIVWEFAGHAHTQDNHSGSSAGLAFFIQFLVFFLQKQRCPRASFSVAATGELSDLTITAHVQPILFLEEKLKAAFAVLKPGDKVFYPIANKRISAALLQMALRKGIEVRAVSKTHEMAEIIFSWFENETDPLSRVSGRIIRYVRNSRYLLWSIAFFVVAVTVFLICHHGLDQKQLIYSIEQGDFADIPIEQLQATKDEALINLSQKTHTPLFLKTCFIYRADKRLQYRDAEALSQMQNIQLEEGAGYRFEVQVDQPCYFYLFQFEGDASVDLLFPLSSFDLDDHYLRDHQLYMIPGNTKYFYFKSTGVRRLVTLFFLGSSWRANDLEKLCQEYDQASGAAEKARLRNQILLHIQKRSQALRDGWQGLYCQQSYFWRQ